MYENQRILQLHRQGYCAAAISVRLNVQSATVRAIVAKEEAREALRSLQPDAVRQARRDKAEDKRKRALRLLAEADAVLEQ